MIGQQPDDRWHAGDAYEAFMGRWSRPLAEQFIRWLHPEPRLSWLDVGCGTGALATTVCRIADPESVTACDPAEPLVEYARRNCPDPRLRVLHAGAGGLPSRPGGFDRVVSGLVLNFLPDPSAAVQEMRTRARDGGVIAAYVWDYAGGMEPLRRFWDEATSVDEKAKGLDEGVRFPLCRRDALESLFSFTGLRNVESESIEIPVRFNSFADYWTPFTGGTGPAPSFVASLCDASRSKLRDRLEHRLMPGPDGAIHLVARAWAVRGSVPD